MVIFVRSKEINGEGNNCCGCNENERICCGIEILIYNDILDCLHFSVVAFTSSSKSFVASKAVSDYFQLIGGDTLNLLKDVPANSLRARWVCQRTIISPEFG